MTTTNTVFLTKKGMKDLKKQLTRLERERSALLAALRDSDKSEAHDERLARVEKLANLDIIESDIADTQAVLAHAKPMPRKRDAFKVVLGSVVELLDTNGRVVHYTLVDSLEADPSDGRISVKSPLGQSLMGKQLRDVIEWSAGVRRHQLQLVGIR